MLKIWVCACSTGEEAYSLAMLVAERTMDVVDAPKVQIFATDIDESAIAQARESQIQLALERVRARTMAMQKSEELAETVSLLFKQLLGLGVEASQIRTCAIVTFHSSKPIGECWIS